MKAWDIVAYTYEADIYCTKCAFKRFDQKLYDGINPPEDREGNYICPVFQINEFDQPICGTCREIIE